MNQEIPNTGSKIIDVIEGNWKEIPCPMFPRWGELKSIYYFLPTNLDTLTLGATFTGNVKLIFATFSGNTGLDPQLSGSTPTNSPESARTAPADLVWNQVEATVTDLVQICGSTFDGVIGSYALDDVWTHVSRLKVEAV